MALSTPHHRGGTGEPLVLLHGLTGSWRVWRPLLPLLEEHHDVFAPTLPGHAGGARLPDGFQMSMTAFVDLVEAQLDEAGIDTAHIAGNSLGGWTALELGRRGRARSVVALSPAGAWASPRDRDRVVRMFAVADAVMSRSGHRLLPLMRRPRFRRMALRSVAERGDRLSAAEATELLQDTLDCAVVKDFLAWVRTEASYLAAEGPAAHPITIAWSASDRTIPFERYGRPMLAAVPGARQLTLPGVGHVPMLDDPQLVARTILATTTAAAAQPSASSPPMT